jgi:hypothetical protein
VTTAETASVSARTPFLDCATAFDIDQDASVFDADTVGIFVGS